MKDFYLFVFYFDDELSIACFSVVCVAAADAHAKGYRLNYTSRFS
jgi:hypothetical protein